MSNPERIVIDDLIVLGNAAPDEISDFRTTVCTAGFSPTHGLIRIYPVPPWVKMHRWHRVRVPLERNPQDVRSESWKIQGSKDEWSRLHERIQIGEKLNRREWIDLLDRLQRQFGVDCVQELNNRRLSLGIIRPRHFRPYFKSRENYSNEMQQTLFGDEPFMTICNYAHQPRLEYTCQNCQLVRGFHDQQIIEWGVYEWMRNNPDKIEDVWKNLHIGEPNYETRLLVGNQARHLTSFMVISIFRYKVG
jgi:hypothetical protein